MGLPCQYFSLTMTEATSQCSSYSFIKCIVNLPQTYAEDECLRPITDASIHVIFFNGPSGQRLLSPLSDVGSEVAVKHESYYP